MDVLGMVQGIGSVLGAGGNAVSQYLANRQNLELQRQEWQREDTSMQRKVADLKAAGLNPVLAAQGGGEPTSLTARVAPVGFDMPDLSHVYAANIARQQSLKGASESDIASTEAVLAKEGMKAKLAYGIPWSNAWNEGLTAGYNMEKSKADAARAVELARLAKSEADINDRNNRLNEKYQEAQTIAGIAGNVLSGAKTGVTAGLLLAK